MFGTGPQEVRETTSFIGNYSTGKMGIELANSVARSGGTVTLICGPTNLKSHESGIQTIEVSSAEEMYNKVHKYFDSVLLELHQLSLNLYQLIQTNILELVCRYLVFYP